MCWRGNRLTKNRRLAKVGSVPDVAVIILSMMFTLVESAGAVLIGILASSAWALLSSPLN